MRVDIPVTPLRRECWVQPQAGGDLSNQQIGIRNLGKGSTQFLAPGDEIADINLPVQIEVRNTCPGFGGPLRHDSPDSTRRRRGFLYTGTAFRLEHGGGNDWRAPC